MSNNNSDTWLQEFTTAIQSRTRCFGFTFNHEDYVLDSGTPVVFEQYLKDYLNSQHFEMIVQFSLSEGVTFYQVANEPEVNRRFEKYTGISLLRAMCKDAADENLPLQILRGFDRLLKQSEFPVAIILKYAEHMVPNNPANGGFSQQNVVVLEELFSSWATSPVVAAGNNLVIMFAREGYISECVRERWNMIKVDLPDIDTRKNFIDRIIEARVNMDRRDFAKPEEAMSRDTLAALTSGLTLRAIEKLFRRAAVLAGATLTHGQVKSAKANEISRMCGDLLEVFDTDSGFESIAGMHYIKRYFGLLKEQLKLGGNDIARAILMVGVPGVGKSFSIRALAHELGFTCVALRSVRSMWVGESERNLERAFNAIEALSPAILFFDEIDQALGQRGAQGDSGVSQRMLARIWEFMAMEKLRGKIIFVAATNMPGLLDPATKDRFGVTIPFLLPSAAEMAELIPVLAGQLGLKLAVDVDCSQLSQLLTEKRVSPRQAMEVISMARVFYLVNGQQGNAIPAKALVQAAKSFQPNSDPFELEIITLEALQMTTFNELLPWYGLPVPVQLPAYAESAVDESTGELNRERLRQRLYYLRSQSLA